jgi:hypothetical protein
MLDDAKKNGVITQLVNRILDAEEWIRNHKMTKHIASVSSDGWIPVSGTWTYASASTINVPTDATLIYKNGIKIRFKQGGGYKYYVASAVAATLLTVIVNTDYTVANSAITDIYYSYIENPLGWPAYFTYTPSLSSNAGAFTNASVTGRYKTNGNLLTCFNTLTITTNGTASSFTNIGMPVTTVAFNTAGVGVETGVTGFIARADLLASTSIMRMTKYDGTYLGGNGYVITTCIHYLF